MNATLYKSIDLSPDTEQFFCYIGARMKVTRLGNCIRFEEWVPWGGTILPMEWRYLKDVESAQTG